MVSSDRRRREKDLVATLGNGRESIRRQDLLEYFDIRFDRLCEMMISTGDDLTRGRLQELRDIRKIFDGRIDSATDAL